MGYDFDSFDFSIEFPQTQIRFISCGDTFTSKKSLIQTLLESFDTKCWIAIAIVCFVFIPFSWSVLASKQNTSLNIDCELFFVV